MGLGSIVGTGLFVSLGIAAGVTGGGILLALPLAALLALFNGLSSAQLAAAHPVSGGTYEYGHRFLTPALGFSAGWTFLLAKSGSAATAALGLAGYLLLATLGGVGGNGTGPAAAGADPTAAEATARIAVGGAAVVLLTVLVAGGIRRSTRVNIAIVGVTLAVFAVFLAVGLPGAITGLLTGDGGLAGTLKGVGGGGPLEAGEAGDLRGARGTLLPAGTSGLLHATALLFVAYTGYGRIATLGEEVKRPRRTIPRAIWITLGVVAALYMGVALVALHTLGVEGFARATAETAAPLQLAAEALGAPGLGLLVGVAAVTAMLGVLLNLILGLSRVALAMGRRRDLPGGLSRVHASTGSPRAAVIAVGAVILLLVLLGDVRTTWSFSAFTVLVYYGITNLAALRLPTELRLYPRWIPAAGLAGCLFLSFQVEPVYWVVGVGLLAGGLGLRWALRGRAADRHD